MRGNKRRMKLSGDKGVAQIFYVVLIVLVGIIVGESVYLQNYVANTDFMKRSVRETAIIESINTMEFVKKFMKESLRLSFYKSSVDVLGTTETAEKSTGGFCCYDSSCDASEECKIPLKVGDTYIPTHKCQPWWRIYEDTYAPGTDAFIDYLENRTAKIYQSYTEDLEDKIKKATIPEYCPVDKTNPPGNITIEDFAGSSGIEDSETGAIRLNASNNYGDPLTYKDIYLEITEPNSFFYDSFAVSTLELFKVAREEFAEDDWVENQFDEGNEDMPNTFCEMVYASGGVCSADTTGCYCNTTAECWTNSDKETNCWGSDCCCRKIHFGDLCEPLSASFCDSKLPTYCRKEDKTKTDACNFDRKARSGDTTKVTADEKYNCTMIARLGTYGNPKVTSFDDWVESTTRIENCIIPGHESEISTGESFDVDWREWRDNKEQVQWKCDAILRKGCGCEDYCFEESEYEDGCDPQCNGITPGEHGGKCPTDYPWNDMKTVTCPTDCCAIEFNCYEWVDSCTGDNAEPCTSASNCPTTCCYYDSGCSGCEGCDCAGVACGGDCSSSCCSLVGESCVNPYTCPSCCGGSSAGNRDPSCNGKRSCSKIDPNGNECPCGCDEVWKHRISFTTRSEACGYGACEQTYAYVTNVRCDYDYIGTANISAVVSDVENSYPIDSEWKGLSTAFYIASGNTDNDGYKCDAITTDDDTDTTAVEYPEWQYCKCKFATTPEPTTTTTTVPTTTYTTTVYVHDYYLDRKILSALVRLYGSGFDETKNTLNRDYITFKTGYLANAQLSASKSGYENAPNPYQHPSSMSITVDGDKTYTLWLRGRSPTCSITSIKLNPYTPYSYTSGTTIWYNPVDSLYNVFAVNVYASSFETEPLLDSYWLLAVNFPNTVSAGESKYPPSYYFTTLTTSHTYSWDSGATYSGASTVTVYDVLSHRGTCDFTVTRDAEAPTTTAYITGSNPYTITLTCTDNAGGAGCGNTLYCTDEYDMCTYPLNTYTPPVSISCSGHCYVRYYSSDKVGNQESIKSVPFGSSMD